MYLITLGLANLKVKEALHLSELFQYFHFTQLRISVMGGEGVIAPSHPGFRSQPTCKISMDNQERCCLDSKRNQSSKPPLLITIGDPGSSR